MIPDQRSVLRRSIQTVGCMLLGFVVSGCAKAGIESSSGVAFEGEMRRAQRLQDGGQITNAIAVYDEIIAAALTKEQRGEALLHRALLRITLKDYRGALSDVSLVEGTRTNAVLICHLRGGSISRARALSGCAKGIVARAGVESK
jgi:hypothetical protein